MSELGETLANAEPRSMLLLRGVIDGETTEWHVNKNSAIMAGEATRRHAIVLQKADASEQWVTAILDKTNEGWNFDELTLFEGDPPRGMSADEHGESLDPEDVTVMS